MADLDFRTFVYRARRVAAHSLTQDRKRLAYWAQSSLTLSQRETGELIVSMELPEEEPAESLAARCRPFIAERGLDCAAVIDRVRPCYEGNSEASKHLDGLAEIWRKIGPDDRGAVLGMAISHGPSDAELGPLVSDKQLGYAWLYSDLFHADDKAAVIDGHGLNMRFQAGVHLVTKIAGVVLPLLDAVRVAFDAGLMPELTQADFETPVSATLQKEYVVTQAMTGPAIDPDSLRVKS